MQPGVKTIYQQLSIAVIFAVFAVSDVMADETMTKASLPMVIYIGTNEYPPENVDAATQAGITLGIYNLDARRNMEERMMDGLPASPEESTVDFDTLQNIVEQRFNALSETELKSIFQPIMLVQRWDIRKTPAFIFGDGEAVIYGLTDVEEMLDYWQEWRQTQSGEALQQ